MNLHTVKSWLLEALFPSFCLGCHIPTYNQPPRPGSDWLCAACAAKTTPQWHTICHLCGKDVGITRRGRCAHPTPALASLSHIFRYDQEVVRALIHALKYRYIQEVASEFALFCSRERLNLLRIPVDMVIPLPLHPRRYRMRGFNQSAHIARQVAELIHTPLVTTLLRRTRNTSAQVSLARPRQRQKNIAGAFGVSAPHLVRGNNILLVDDVVTTGATLEEAAHTLRRAGARTVHGFVIARD